MATAFTSCTARAWPNGGRRQCGSPLLRCSWQQVHRRFTLARGRMRFVRTLEDLFVGWKMLHSPILAPVVALVLWSFVYRGLVPR
jgi:hypothetical protein